MIWSPTAVPEIAVKKNRVARPPEKVVVEVDGTQYTGEFQWEDRGGGSLYFRDYVRPVAVIGDRIALVEARHILRELIAGAVARGEIKVPPNA